MSLLSMTQIGDSINISSDVAAGTPTRGRSYSSPHGITPMILGEEQVMYQVSTNNTTSVAGTPSLPGLDSVDQALSNVLSLPQVLSQVTNKFKDHTQEIDRLKQHIDQKMIILSTEGLKLQGLIDDIRSTERHIFMGEDKADQIKRICQQYQNDLNTLVKTVNHVQEEVLLKENALEMLVSRLEKYELKMVKHVQKVNVIDEDIDTFRQLRLQRESTEKLEMQKKKLEEDADATKVLNGTAEIELRAAVEIMKEALKQTECNYQNQQQKLKNSKSRQKQLQMDISVLLKRNAAQMTRMKRQVKEVNNSNKHWQEQASYLEAAIQHLKSDESINIPPS